MMNTAPAITLRRAVLRYPYRLVVQQQLQPPQCMLDSIMVVMRQQQTRTLTQYRNNHDTTKTPTETTATTTSSLNDNVANETETEAEAASAADHHVQDVTEWVPPDRPLPGDLGQTYLYRGTTSSTMETTPPTTTTAPTTTPTPTAPDWLSTRRKALSMEVDEKDGGVLETTKKNRKFAGAELEVLDGRLLSVTEIITCLTTMGALQVTTVPDPLKRMGGADGIVFSTATSSAHLQLLTETLVRQLKVRKLGDRGVAGARHGAARKGTDWEVIDCYNYIVHIMLESTRRDLNLEALWNGQDPLFSLKINDEETVDNYVANHPVPATYGGGAADMDSEDVSKRISELQRWNIGHRAVIPKPKRKQGAKRGANRSR